MICTRCSGTGFINLEQVDEKTLREFDSSGDEGVILDWINRRDDGACYCSATPRPPCSWCESRHDVSVCDCCGDGEYWYGECGQHNYHCKDEPFPQCI